MSNNESGIKMLENLTSILFWFPFLILILGIIIIALRIRRETGSAGYIWDFLTNMLHKMPSILMYSLSFLWWLIPIFPSKRENAGFTRWGMWGPETNRWYLGGSIATLLSLGLLYYTLTAHGIANYGWIISAPLLVIGMLSLFVVFARKELPGNSRFPRNGTNRDKRDWLMGESSKYLKYLIAMGLGIMVITFISYFLGKHILFTTTGTVVIMGLIGMILMYMAYLYLKENTQIKDLLKNSSIFAGLFNIVFILPCLFQEVVKYIYTQFKHTPNVVYSVFLIEILLVGIYLIIPILKKYFYTFMPGNDDELNLIKSDIKNTEQESYIMKYKIRNLKKYDNLLSEDWTTIFREEYDQKDNEEDLSGYLSGLGYNDKKLNEAIKYIQTNGNKIRGLEIAIKNNETKIRELSKKKNLLGYSDKGKILLNKPVYLKNKKILKIGQKFGWPFEEEEAGNYLKYKYNYAISGWFFIRAQGSSYGANYSKYTSILRYKNQIDIKYNSSLNKLKIIMNNGYENMPNDLGLGNKSKEIIYNDVPLQKWINVVVNYDGGVLDVFVDSKLIASLNNIIPYMKEDVGVLVGEEDGIAGGVCNVVYFPHSISLDRIKTNYNLLKNKNPPII